VEVCSVGITPNAAEEHSVPYSNLIFVREEEKRGETALNVYSRIWTDFS